MNVVRTEQELVDLQKTVFRALARGCQEYEAESGLPVGMAFDASTGLAKIRFSGILLNGESALNAAFEQAIQGAQTQTGTESSTQGAATETKTTSTGGSTTTSTEGGQDEQLTNYDYSEYG